MKISTEIASAAAFVGEEKAVQLYGEAGFEAWDLSMFAMAKFDRTANALRETDHPLAGKDYLSFVRRLRRIGEEYGMVCNQSHAPFPSYRPQIRAYFHRALECTAEAGGKICVIHPCNDLGAEENAEMFLELLPIAKEYGVKIATENMWNWNEDKTRSTPAACSTSESFLAHLKAVNDPDFVACLDLGHAEMQGSGDGATKMIRDLGPYLQALHIHDNDLLKDRHQIPFSMQMDFAAIIRALKEIGYSGDFTLEADQYLKSLGEEMLEEGVKNLYRVAKQLVQMFREA